MLLCLASCVTTISGFFLPASYLYSMHFSAYFWLFLQAVHLMFLTATEEDYHRVVEMFGYYNFVVNN